MCALALVLVAGKLKWTFLTGGEVWSSPAIDEPLGLLFFGSKDFVLYALDTHSGAMR